MHFDESDENIEEEDELDTELSRLLLDKLSICLWQLLKAVDSCKAITSSGQLSQLLQAVDSFDGWYKLSTALTVHFIINISISVG